MRIAFTGKGGSGKSTITALYVQNLRKNTDKKLLAIDADINENLSALLGTEHKDNKAISKEENTTKIREYIKGDNENIEKPENIVKTTPPGTGSQLIEFKDDSPVFNELANQLDEETFFNHVGTYDEEGIGASCYHTALWGFENILSHLNFKENELLVADMVAGTDAFANSLHLQFDTIFHIVEPTPESLEVYQKYKRLSKEANVFDKVQVIGNKIEDEQDKEYIEENIEKDKIVGYISRKKEIKHSRQKQEIIKPEMIENTDLYEKITETAKANQMSSEERLEHLHKLHRKVAEKGYIQNAYGDITTQIDQDYKITQ